MQREIKNNSVLLAMSGGVDSSVSAVLLKKAGADVIGLYLDIGGRDRNLKFERALAAADSVGVELIVKDIKSLLEKNVIAPFVRTYLRGKTPNPCAICNPTVKFAVLKKEAEERGVNWIATGHYAGIAEKGDGIYHVAMAEDKDKDQSYFLYRLEQNVLSKTIFPLSHIVKQRVKEIAVELDLPMAHARESSEICFIEEDFRSFIESRDVYFPPEGPIIHVRAGEIGRHSGIYKYTVGQRRGLDIAWKAPLYVLHIDPDRNAVWVGEKEDLGVGSFTVEDLFWQGGAGQRDKNEDIFVRIRHRSSLVPCMVKILSHDSCRVELRDFLPVVPPGQAAVFYDSSGIVLGGGWIKEQKFKVNYNF